MPIPLFVRRDSLQTEAPGPDVYLHRRVNGLRQWRAAPTYYGGSFGASTAGCAYVRIRGGRRWVLRRTACGARRLPCSGGWARPILVYRRGTAPARLAQRLGLLSKLIATSRQIHRRANAHVTRDRVLTQLWTALNPKVGGCDSWRFVRSSSAPRSRTRRWRFCCWACCSISTACGSNIDWALAAAWLWRSAPADPEEPAALLDRVAGAMFVGFGMKLALTDNAAAYLF